MGRATPMYNRKNIRGFSDFPFMEYLLDSICEKLTLCNLVSDRSNFIPPSWNIDQLLQIAVKYVFDSYAILITIFILEEMIFSASTIFFFLRHVIAHTLLKTYFIIHMAKTPLPCSILKCYNQVYYYASINLLFCTSVVLVTWLSEYSKYFKTASLTAYTCSLSRFTSCFEKYDWSKYSSKLSTLIWTS